MGLNLISLTLIATIRGDLCQAFFGVTISLQPLEKGFNMRPDEETRALTDNERRTGRASLGRQFGIYALLLVIGFLVGFVPMWLKARQRGNELEVARAELRRSQMRSALSAAALDARRGDYEPARKSMSDFFTTLSNEVDRSDDSTLDQVQREAVRPLLAQRDEIITLLARSDPAAADKLSNLDASYRKAMGNAAPQSSP